MEYVGWPNGSTSLPLEPQNMLPGRIEGYPQGTQRGNNNAEDLLATAVAYWDASQYRDGDRFLRNRGVAGDLLDLRLGSSIAPNSNDPRFLAPEDSGYVYLPGVLGNSLKLSYSTSASGNVWSITAAVDAESAPFYILAGGDSGGGQIGLFATNGVRLGWRDGASDHVISATNGLSFPTGANWIRGTVDATTTTVSLTFEYAPYGGESVPPVSGWTTILTATQSVTNAGVTIPAGQRTIGARNWTTSGVFAAKVYRVIEEIDGTPVLDIDCSQITSGSNTSFTALTGQTVTINRSTSGRKSVAVPSRANRGGEVFLFGTDDYMQVTDNWQHGLLNFGQGDSFTVLAVGRKWGNGYTSTAGIQIGKQGASSSAAGWRLTHGSSTEGLAVFSSDTVGDTAAVARSSAGSLDVLAGTWIGSSGVITTYRDALTDTKTATSGAVSTNSNMRVGRSDITWYADMEFTAAAVFRRALTPAEIKTISDYFTARIA